VSISSFVSTPILFKRISILDSHTGGEPTRVVVAGAPALVGNTVAEKLVDFQNRHDSFRTAVINEPRGSDVMVGAMLCDSPNLDCVTGVIFFNNVGVLGMCGHGMMGVVTTLAFLGRIGEGIHRIETPVGVVTVKLHDDGRVSVTNVASYRKANSVELEIEGLGMVTGDVAWGGNWFFLVSQHGYQLSLDNLPLLINFASRVRHAINEKGYPEVDHVELFGPPVDPANHSRNFVLCPGLAFDRSPCGTGTSAKLACLADEGKLQPGEIWRQESIIGSVFEATYHIDEGKKYPIITGQAWICGEADLIFDPSDPFLHGIPMPALR
jgi:4-hydroxyproline epimerase